jgi:hypothetical protein
VKKNRLKFWNNWPVRFRFYKSKIEKTEPNRTQTEKNGKKTEPNQKKTKLKPSQTEKTEPNTEIKPVGLNRFWFLNFFFLFSYFFIIKTEPNRK